MNRPDVRRACIPATSGIGSARAFARHYAALLPGGIDGVSLLPAERIRVATEPQKPDPADTENPTRWALGYQIGAGYDYLSKRTSGFGHGGFGGSTAFADPEKRLAVCFTRNLYDGGGDTLGAIFEELRAELEL
jgi:CubicO group peptidase (beta-lactamase class C family)